MNSSSDDKNKTNMESDSIFVLFLQYDSTQRRRQTNGIGIILHCCSRDRAAPIGQNHFGTQYFTDKAYVSLENPDQRRFATEDPRGFLNQYPDGAILDEIQNVPELFSYLQQVIDEDKHVGKFILTGSNNFMLQEGISQSLAGRAGYLELLPLSVNELVGIAPKSDNDLMVRGFYPAVYDREIPPEVWYNDYRRTYLERDVRQVKSITRFNEFERLLRLLAGRVAQELNYTALSVEVGVDVKTIQEWISVLERGFIIYRMRPYHRNFNKIIVKRPKLYFYDTGLACSLLGITDVQQIENHPTRAPLFENMIVAETIKWFTNRGDDRNSISGETRQGAKWI